MYCIHCGRELDDNSEYCIHCGIKQSPTPIASQESKQSIQLRNYTEDEKDLKQKRKGFIQPFWVILIVIGGIIIYFLSPFIISFIDGPPYDCSFNDGYIDITNSFDSDVTLSLEDKDNNKIQEIFIPAHDTDRINGICIGRYYLYYIVDGVEYKADHPYDFHDGSYWELELNSKDGGNAGSFPVDRDNSTERSI